MPKNSCAFRGAFLAAVVALGIGSLQTLSAQGQPRHAFPTQGSEVVLVFISTSRCTGNEEERLDDAIRQAKLDLGTRFEAEGHAFYSIGAAAEWSVEEGVRYLLDGVAPGYSQKQFGPWDEIWAGRNWLNNAAIEHIWRGDKRSVVPQLVVFQRSVVRGESGYEVGEEQIIARVVGSQQIVRWFDEGFPVTLR